MKIFIMLLMVIGCVFASEIKVDGTYSKMLGNPFKAKLEVKTQDITVVSSPAKNLELVVETNREREFGFYNPTFSLNSSDCSNVLRTYLSEDFNIVSGSSNSATCEIVRGKVILTYVREQERWMNQLSDIVVELTVRVKSTVNGNLKEFTVDSKMDKSLGKKGDNYNFTIRAAWNPDYSSVEQNIQKIVEYSIYDILNKSFKGVSK